MELIHDESLDTSASERRSVPGQGDTTGTLLADEVVSYLCHEYIPSIGVMFAGRVRCMRALVPLGLRVVLWGPWQQGQGSGVRAQ